MQEQEGVIQYQLEFNVADAPLYGRFAELNYWRSYLFRLGLIGQDVYRYGGLGYGNISARLQPGRCEFLISATQTGHLPLLCRDHYAQVMDFDLQRNFLQATGLHPPSSEALTHASIYLGREDVHCVMHVHCPKIWSLARQQALPATPEHIRYGTPEMALAVQQLVQSQAASNGVVVMLGHEDGILIYGPNEEATGTVLSDLLQVDCA